MRACIGSVVAAAALGPAASGLSGFRATAATAAAPIKNAAAIGIHSRFVTPPLRAAGWWLDLPKWSVRPGEELPRDRTSGAAVAQR